LHAGKRYVRRVGSRYYKAPELLVGFSFYDYAIDIFSAGCVLAGLLLQREPFFRGRDNEDQLVRIACVLGTDGLHRFLRKYNVQLSAELLAAVGKHNKKPWSSFLSADTNSSTSASDKEHCSISAAMQSGFDLLQRMLCYDHQERITAKQALAHPFFDAVRDSVQLGCGDGHVPNA
jgi:casein kinase II subunit alpha